MALVLGISEIYVFIQTDSTPAASYAYSEHLWPKSNPLKGNPKAK